MRASRSDEATPTAGNRRPARSAPQRASRTTDASAASRFTSTSVVFASPVFTAAGSKPGFTTKGKSMLERLRLSIEHSEWLEAERRIPCELATEMGLVTTRDGNLAFEYRRGGAVMFRKVRRETAEGKTFWIDPKGSALCLWNEDCLLEPSEAPLI